MSLLHVLVMLSPSHRHGHVQEMLIASPCVELLTAVLFSVTAVVVHPMIMHPPREADA
jgi:hypothetical protein